MPSSLSEARTHNDNCYHDNCYHRCSEHVIRHNHNSALNDSYIIEYIDDAQLFVGVYQALGACSASEYNTDVNLLHLNPDYAFSFIDTHVEILQPRMIDRGTLVKAGFKCYVAKDKFDGLFTKCHKTSIYLKLEEMLASEE